MYQSKGVAVIVPAAGLGKRMKTDVSKQYIEINGQPILAITLEVFQKAKVIDEIIVVVRDNEIGYVEKYIKESYHLDKIHAIVAGGKERQDSVYAGLKALSENMEIILVHDAVRPFITENELNHIVQKTHQLDACIFGTKVKDTIKEVDENGLVVKTPDRSRLYAIQTPQAFKKDLLIGAYRLAMDQHFQATDDAMIVEKFSSVPVNILEGSYKNIKLTTPEDLVIAEQLLKSKQ